MTSTIKVKMADPERQIWNPVAADYLTGNRVAKVPNVSFWRRRIKDGTLVEVVDAPPAVAATDAPPAPAGPQPAATPSSKGRKKGKKHAAVAVVTKPSESTVAAVQDADDELAALEAEIAALEAEADVPPALDE